MSTFVRDGSVLPLRYGVQVVEDTVAHAKTAGGKPGHTFRTKLQCVRKSEPVARLNTHLASRKLGPLFKVDLTHAEIRNTGV